MNVILVAGVIALVIWWGGRRDWRFGRSRSPKSTDALDV